MPSTAGFEVVAELAREVLVQAAQGAWDQSTIPHSTPIPPGLAFGPYGVAQGTVNIPRAGIDVELVPATNRVRLILATNVQVEIANPPVPSARFFDMATRTQLDLAVGTLPGTVAVGVLLSGITRGDVSVAITSGDPIGPLTSTLVAEYVHARYADGTIPPSITAPGQSLGGLSADVYLEVFDDAAGRAITATLVGSNVRIVLPVRLRLSNVAAPARSPMAVDADIVITAPLVSAAGSVTARLTAAMATVTVVNLVPAPGPEGMNYAFNAAGYPSLPTLLSDELERRGRVIIAGVGDIVVAVPTLAAIETFAGDRTFEAVRAHGDISIWTPQSSTTEVQIRDVAAKVLADAIAFGINAGPGASPGGITAFIPAGNSCAVAMDGAKVIGLIQAAIDRPESAGGFGGLPKTFDNIGGRRARLNSLTPSLINGFIQLEGGVTVFDAIAGSIDVDADFTAKLTLRWIDNPNGTQSIKAEVAGDPDVDLSIGAWILGLILGFFVGGPIGLVIVAVVLSVADDLAETIGGQVIRDQVTGQVQTITAWPPALEGIGTVESRFENPISIDPQSVMFPDAYVVHATFESTVDALADANGPYLVDAGSPVTFAGGPARPDTTYSWAFGDGATATQMTAVHTYGDDGLYVARLTTSVGQPGGVVTNHYAAVRARNVQPRVEAGPTITIEEGEEVEFVARFEDAEWLDTHVATFFFGDDTLPVPGTVTETNDEPAARGEARARHAYCDDGEYTLTVQVRDDDGGVGTDTRLVIVRNVPPTVDTAGEIFVLPGMPVTLRACFADPGWCDTHTATWDPGDCSAIRTAIVRERHEPPEGIGTAFVTHVYERCGTYLATCTVVDDDGGVGRATLVVHVVELQNAGFEHGFSERGEGLVANSWEPYTSPPGHADRGSRFEAEAFVVHGGQRSQRMLASPGGLTGIRQGIGANLGWDYQVAAWVQVPVAFSDSKARLGIDPSGGDDPGASSVTWWEAAPSDVWVQLAGRVTAAGARITIFLEVAGGPKGGGRIHVDDVELLAEACGVDECEGPKPQPDERRCVGFGDREPGRFESELTIDGFRFVALDNGPLMITSLGPPGVGLRIPAKGLQVTLAFTSVRVSAEILTPTKDPVRLVALGEGGQMLADVESRQDVERLEVTADAIAWVVLSGGSNEALLIEICAERGRRPNDVDPSPTAAGVQTARRKGR